MMKSIPCSRQTYAMEGESSSRPDKRVRPSLFNSNEAVVVSINKSDDLQLKTATLKVDVVAKTSNLV